jgi:hypothetical protein
VVHLRKDDKPDTTLGTCTKSELDGFVIMPVRERHNLEGLIKQLKKRTCDKGKDETGRKKRNQILLLYHL